MKPRKYKLVTRIEVWFGISDKGGSSVLYTKRKLVEIDQEGETQGDAFDTE